MIASGWLSRVSRTAQEKKAELFFGQKWSGDTLAQLNTPASITFFQGSAYIADAMNSRILKLLVIRLLSTPFNLNGKNSLRSTPQTHLEP